MEFLKSSPQSLDGEAKVAFVVHRMGVGHYRHVPITDTPSHPIAIISVRDVLRYLVESVAEADAWLPAIANDLEKRVEVW